ncbi:MAG TPA: virion core protein (lumpy skin disease virus) [Bacteroidales bacterium]|nr:virion core protein (lumpy skin disease virus) [Bacteroidales bacterium]
MSIFNNKPEGGLMDVIRCDEQEYLVWKWSPTGIVNTTNKENAIRYGSSIRVKDGELAVFFYKQNNGTIQDFIIGPHDQTIKTANFPILTGIVGAAFGGKSPFQAEIYYINLAGNIQIRFGIPYFDVFDQRFPDLGVPCAVRGTLTFNITDYRNFIKLNRLINFSLEDFRKQIQDVTSRKIKQIVINIPGDTGIPAMQMERKISEINDYVKPMLSSILSDDFGVNLKRLDIGAIELDKEHPHYQQLKKSTVDQQTKFIDVSTDIQLEGMRLQVEQNNLAAFTVNKQADVAKTAAESLGKLGGSGTTVDGGFNAAGLVAGAMVGGAVGGGLGQMIGNTMHGFNQSQQTPPPPPIVVYMIYNDGKQSGPFNLQQLQVMVQNGQLNKETIVWKQGMSNWDQAGNVAELSFILGSVTPPPPPINK